MSIILRRRDIKFTGITKNNLPHFVKFRGEGSAMRLRYTNEYYRDGGDWSINVIIKDGRLFVNEKGGIMEHMDGCELIEITKKEWELDNGGYVPLESTIKQQLYNSYIETEEELWGEEDDFY